MTEADGAFHGHLDFGVAPALVVVDVVQAYTDPASPLSGHAFGAALPQIGRLIAAARERGVPVVHTRVVYRPGGVDGGLFYRKIPALRVFDAGSPLAAFVDAVAPTSRDIIVTKQYASAFFGTSLASALRATGVDTVVLCGFSTSGCVRASALDALQLGFSPFVARDACADRSGEIHDANLSDLQAKYAEVVGTDAAVRHLRGTATDETRR